MIVLVVGIAASISAVIVVLSICALIRRRKHKKSVSITNVESVSRVLSQSPVEGNTAVSMTNVTGSAALISTSTATAQFVDQNTSGNLNGEGHEQTNIMERHENTSGDEDNELYDKMDGHKQTKHRENRSDDDDSELYDEMDDPDATAGLYDNHQNNMNMTPTVGSISPGL